jgi:hypothetical protein
MKTLFRKNFFWSCTSTSKRVSSLRFLCQLELEFTFPPRNQSCQICLGTTYQNGGKCTKSPQNLPNYHNMYQITTKNTKVPQNIPNYQKIYQITTKYTKSPQNIPNYHNIYQMCIKTPHDPKMTFVNFPLQDLPKYINSGIWGNENIPSGNPARNGLLVCIVHMNYIHTFKTIDLYCFRFQGWKTVPGVDFIKILGVVYGQS